MSLPTEDFTIGVEEEYQIIDPKTRELRSRVQQILPLAQKALGEVVQPEVQQSQIEIATPVCRSLSEVRAELVRLRRNLLPQLLLTAIKLPPPGHTHFPSGKNRKSRPKNVIKD